jgi:ATP-dependent RNA helicase DDX5/DBP2
MSYYSRGGNNNNNNYGSSKGSYGNNNRTGNGNSLLDDLDSFDVGPLRPGPPIIKNFYSESSLIKNRAQHLIDQFYDQNEMAVRGYAPKPILSFDEIQLSSSIQNVIQRLGYVRPTPIQSQAWPILLNGNDLVGIAQTGSGKTLSFMIPALIHAAGQSNTRSGDPLVLILAPTRELAQQIQVVGADLCAATNARSTCIYGGAPKPPQKREIRYGLEVCIATPGRLLDFVREKTINLDRVTFLVLDEADRMLDMGFEPQIRKIAKCIRPDRQTAMFSATWPKEVQKLASDFLTNCSHITLGKAILNANQNIHQIVDVCEEFEKESKLAKVLAAVMRDQNCKVIIFAQTKKRVDDFFFTIKRLGYPVFHIHGDKRQNERDRVLKEFRARPRVILIATDVAARGLDIDDIRIVINLDYPAQTEDYVHRIGRTARSGAKGTAYSFFTRENAKQAQELIQLLKDSNQDVNEKLYDMSKTKYFGNANNGKRGGNYRGGIGRRGGSSNMNGNRNGYNNNAQGTQNNSRPSRFSAKRSRSRSPGHSTYDGSSHFNSNHGNDSKRFRTDNSHPSHEEPRHPYSSTSNGQSSNSIGNIPPPLPSSSATTNSYTGFYKQMTSYPPPRMPSMYPQAYQTYAKSQQPPLPSGPPPSS